ncbi:hypothetical protein TrCOL_g9061 [Triparma columacea]|uniref:AB hydrolase-1 domain-containing protein n=1 Tax=Triparma columacea TaxID=722753 RepID=A0A9W7GL59_9STRA|nr:hypothetical protein TrCOL_g9061 [Triparma columacea]
MTFDLNSFLLGLGCTLGLYVLHVTFRRLIFGVGPVFGQPRSHAPGKFANLSYGEVHYTIYGEGGRAELSGGRPLVVLVHGYCGSSMVWKVAGYLELLSGLGYDVLTFDNYGHGFSEGPDVTYSAELFSSQLSELLSSLSITGAFDLLGFSMGGSIVTLYAHRHPGRVKRLILQAPSIARDPIFPRILLRFLGCLPFISEIAARLVIPHFGEGANTDNDAVVRAGYRLAKVMAEGSWVVGGRHQEDLLRDIANYDREVLVLWGDKDKAVAFGGSKVVMGILGERGRLVVGKGADHMTFSELDTKVGEVFRRELGEFLGPAGVGVGEIKVDVKNVKKTKT